MKRSTTTHLFGKRLVASAAIASMLLLFAPFLGPSSALARPPGDGMAKLVDQLDLDAATQSQVDAILDSKRDQRRALHRELRDARETMRDLMASADADEATLLGQAERIGAIEQERHALRIGTHLQLRSILSKDQMQSLAEAKRSRAHPRGRGN